MGRGEKTRTSDLHVPNVARCQLCYTPMVLVKVLSRRVRDAFSLTANGFPEGGLMPFFALKRTKVRIIFQIPPISGVFFESFFLSDLTCDLTLR